MADSRTISPASILARMIRIAPNQKLGRTQVMKLFFFLQELKDVPLGYNFRLFTYGPFDSEVLSDLATACNLGTVQEKTVIYPRGYGYEITAGENAEKLSSQLAVEAPQLATLIDEIVQEFGSFSAAELELISTILFVDREMSQDASMTSYDQIVSRVHSIKPHFTQGDIKNRVVGMANKSLLKTLPTTDVTACA